MAAEAGPPLLPLPALCPTCAAVMANESVSHEPLPESSTTLFMTVRDETGRRAVIRHDIPKEIWLDLDPSKAGIIIVTDLRDAHQTLKRQAKHDAERRQARDEA